MMALDEPRSCPDPETLGSFVAGTLHPGVQQQVADHAADCNFCIWVIRETANYDRHSVTAAPRWWRFLPAAAGFILAVLAALLIVVRYPADPVRRMAAAAHQSGVRTIEGRVVHFDYGRYTSTRSLGGANTTGSIAAQGVLDDTDRPGSAREWHQRGIASLLVDRIEAAVRQLSEAVRLAPESGEYRSDLAAARIALGTARQDETEFRRALADAVEALRLSPASRDATFNRALALERLGDRDAALRAYEEYLALDSDSEWAREARWRMNRLRR